MRNRTASHFLFSSNLSGVSDDDLWLPPIARNRSRDTDFLAAVGFLWRRRKLASVLSPYERCEYLVGYGRSRFRKVGRPRLRAANVALATCPHTVAGLPM